MSIDIDYYRRRVDRARQQAEQATRPEARRVHLELASRYQEMLAQEAPAAG